MDIKRLVFSLAIVFVLVVTACSQETALPLSTPPPSAWPTTWTGLSTDAADGGGEDHRDVTDTNGDAYALYYTTDSEYLYLRMETVEPPGWPTTNPTGDARYKWWFDTAGTDLYVGGTSVYKGEFLLILEDRTDTSNVDGNRDQLGELTLMDDLTNLGFRPRWNSGGSGAYITGIPDSGGNSTLWMRQLGSGTAGTGGPQGVMGPDIGYRIDNVTTGGNFTDVYISWAALGNPSSLCLIWATDNQVVNLDQAPNLDRPEATTCLSICTPPQAAFNATPTSGCAPLTVSFTDQSTGNITGWNWTFGDGGTSTLQNPSHQYTSAGSYNVTLNVTTACSSDAETKTNYITVYSGPTADAGGDKSIPSCGGSATIGGSPTGSGGTPPYTYSWTPAGGLNDTTIANPTASASGNYTVRVTDANGCWDEDSVVVTVSGAPTADAGPDQDVCLGASVVIGGSPAASGGTPPYTYNWTPVTGLNATYIANPTASPTTTTNYSLTITDSLGCKACDCVIVTVDTPTCHISASPSDSVCESTTVTLTEDGGDAVSWSWSTGASTQSIQVTSNGTYNVTITDAYGCQSSCQISMTVYDGPTADAGPDKQILCGAGSVLIGGSPTALNGTSPYSYQWAPDTGLNDTAIANPSASAAGTFAVTVTDSNGCKDIDSVTVTVVGGPTADAGGDTGFCAGGSVQLSGSATGGTVPYTYDWTGSENHPNTQNPTVSTAGTYTLNVTDGNGCSDTDDVIVAQYPSPTAEAGADAVIISGESVVIGGTPTASGGTPLYTYSWTPTIGLNNATAANPTASPTVNTTYTVTVTDSNGCTDSDDMTVTVIQDCCICGFVYRAGTMQPLAGWAVVLEEQQGNLWVQIGSNITDANGKYCFCGLLSGYYRVSEVVQPGWNQVSPLPNEHLVTLPGGCCDPLVGPFLDFQNEQAGPFAVGWQASPIDRLAVVAPWIVLFAVIVAGTTLLVLRRRRI
jgi:PKD repeat protein